MARKIYTHQIVVFDKIIQGMTVGMGMNDIEAMCDDYTNRGWELVSMWQDPEGYTRAIFRTWHKER